MLKSMRKSKNRYFYHIFVSPGDAPAAITLNVVWMEREFDAYKLSRSMYLSIFNSFLWGRPWGNHAKCCMDVNRIRCLQIVSLHVPIKL